MSASIVHIAPSQELAPLKDPFHTQNDSPDPHLPFHSNPTTGNISSLNAAANAASDAEHDISEHSLGDKPSRQSLPAENVESTDRNSLLATDTGSTSQKAIQDADEEAKDTHDLMMTPAPDMQDDTDYFQSASSFEDSSSSSSDEEEEELQSFVAYASDNEDEDASIPNPIDNNSSNSTQIPSTLPVERDISTEASSSSSASIDTTFRADKSDSSATLPATPTTAKYELPPTPSTTATKGPVRFSAAEISLDEEQKKQSRNIFQMASNAISNASATIRSSSPSSSTPTEHKPHPSPIDTSVSQDNNNNNSNVTSRSLFNLWSSIKNVSVGKRRTSESSSNGSVVVNTPLIVEHRSLATEKRQSKRLSQQQRSTSEPLLGNNKKQDDVLARMEQLNTAKTNDPKARMLLNLKRQSIRESLASQHKGSEDDYDWDFWAGALCEFDQIAKTKKLSHHVQHGIPPSIRGMVWQLMSNSKNAELEERYLELLNAPSPYDKMIQRDLARTFPGHKFFKERDSVGQEGLYNVVRSYSVYDQEVGYCQGLAFVVGPLLLNMPDDEAFCVLVQLMEKYGFRGHFTPDMEGLHLRLYQFDALVEEHLPHIARHLAQQGVGSTMYASQWFMTLFAYKFPLNLVFRIYDIVFTEGVIAVLKIAVALLKRNQTTILGLDFEHLLDFLKNGLFEEYKDDDRRLVEDACNLEITPRRLAQLEKEHKAQMAKDAADARTLDQLQRTNAELREQVKQLEKSMAKAQQEHADIQEQLQRSRADLTYAKDEQSSLQDLVELLRAEVKTLPGKIEEQCQAQFEQLCNENAKLVQKNSELEDLLAQIEATVIDMKMRYALSENEREELQKRLHEMKKLVL